MSELRIAPRQTSPRSRAITSVSAGGPRILAGWRFVGFEVVRIPAGEAHPIDGQGDEACAVVLDGRCELRAAGQSSVVERATVFDGPPGALYLSPGIDGLAIARTDVEIAIGSAPGSAGAPSRSLPSTGARLEVRGSGAMERRIHHILMEDQPASSLLVTEVVTPAGHWSSYPPHKHDTDDPPRECALEETYYFRFADPRGFGLMRVYTKDGSLDESIAVHDRDLVLVPRGYHTFSAAPGYDAYYLNVMAGPRREWKITFDADHERMRW